MERSIIPPKFKKKSQKESVLRIGEMALLSSLHTPTKKKRIRSPGKVSTAATHGRRRFLCQAVHKSSQLSATATDTGITRYPSIMVLFSLGTTVLTVLLLLELIASVLSINSQLLPHPLLKHKSIVCLDAWPISIIAVPHRP